MLTLPITINASNLPSGPDIILSNFNVTPPDGPPNFTISMYVPANNVVQYKSWSVGGELIEDSIYPPNGEDTVTLNVYYSGFDLNIIIHARYCDALNNLQANSRWSSYILGPYPSVPAAAYPYVEIVNDYYYYYSTNNEGGFIESWKDTGDISANPFGTVDPGAYSISLAVQYSDSNGIVGAWSEFATPIRNTIPHAPDFPPDISEFTWDSETSEYVAMLSWSYANNIDAYAAYMGQIYDPSLIYSGANANTELRLQPATSYSFAYAYIIEENTGPLSDYLTFTTPAAP